MREAIGSAFLVNMILLFIGVISALLVGSISYSKAYKVKDRIVYIIEKHDGWKDDGSTQKEIDKQLGTIGYQVGSGSNFSCEAILKKRYGNSNFDLKKLKHGANLGVGGYNYCVYENSYPSAPGKYYTVITFMQFDVPLLGNFLRFPVNGETSLVYAAIDN